MFHLPRFIFLFVTPMNVVWWNLARMSEVGIYTYRGSHRAITGIRLPSTPLEILPSFPRATQNLVKKLEALTPRWFELPLLPRNVIFLVAGIRNVVTQLPEFTLKQNCIWPLGSDTLLLSELYVTICSTQYRSLPRRHSISYSVTYVYTESVPSCLTGHDSFIALKACISRDFFVAMSWSGQRKQNTLFTSVGQ
jgi:hypothetical protein